MKICSIVSLFVVKICNDDMIFVGKICNFIDWICHMC